MKDLNYLQLWLLRCLAAAAEAACRPVSPLALSGYNICLKTVVQAFKAGQSTNRMLLSWAVLLWTDHFSGCVL